MRQGMWLPQSHERPLLAQGIQSLACRASIPATPKGILITGLWLGAGTHKPVLTRRTLSGLLGPDRTRLWRPTKIHIQRRSRDLGQLLTLNAPAQSARLFDTAATFARVFPANKCALLGPAQSSSQTRCHDAEERRWRWGLSRAQLAGPAPDTGSN
jgi:hypothetical protein